MGEYKTIDGFSTKLHLSLNENENQVNQPTFSKNLVENPQQKPVLQEIKKQEIVQEKAVKQEEEKDAPTYTYPVRKKERGIYRLTAVRVRNIRKALVRSLGMASFKLHDDNIAWTGFDKSQPQKLHNSRGTKLLNDQRNVLEFDMAGSGYQGFPQQQHEVGGKVKDKITGVVLSSEQVKKIWAERYGEEVEVKGKKRKFVRKKSKTKEVINDETNEKETFEKRRITMAGPLALGGILNAGEYKIENLREYMLELGSKYILEKLPNAMVFEALCKKKRESGESEESVKRFYEGWMEWYNYKPITLVLRGHSRGGVAMSHGAMMIQYWINENIPSFKDLIKFETVQYDPVSGPHMEKEKTEISLLGGTEKEKKRLAKKKMAPLNEDSNATVVYSLSTQYGGVDFLTNHIGGSFTPQIVKGAKRLILTPYNHSVGLRDLDISQKSETQKNHRAGYTYAKKDANGKVKADFYRSSGLNELEEGVFVADEEGILKKIDSYEAAMNFLDLAYKELGGDYQGHRHAAIRKAIKVWFDNHDENV